MLFILLCIEDCVLKITSIEIFTAGEQSNTGSTRFKILPYNITVYMYEALM